MGNQRLYLHKKGFQVALSPLEEDILHVLWKKKEARVREIHARLKKKAALTSIAVSLDRLHKKHAVTRRVETGRGGSHYVYAPLKTKDELQRSLVDSTVNRLISNFGGVAVTYFNERFGRRRKK